MRSDTLLGAQTEHEALLTKARARQRDAFALAVEVERSLAEGLAERLAFFARFTADEAIFERIVEQWLANVTLLWKRFTADRSAIDRAFGLEGASVVDARTNLGDAHAGGHTVSRVAFSDGTFLIYKPRPVRLERFFSEVLAWASTPELSFEGLHVLERDTYGWVRGVPARGCEDAPRFHARLGGLLAIAHAFGATDLHEDNLIAHGDHPILLDLETLITPRATDDGDALAYSVFDSGLLPSWEIETTARGARLSGGIGGGLFDERVSGNVPQIGEAPIAPFDFVADVRRGFRSTAQRLCERKGELLELAATIKDASYRVVLRPTREYWSALMGALGDAATPLRISLARALGARPQLAAELASLAVLDIPSFGGTISGTTIRAESGDAVTELAESPWTTLTARLAALEPDAIAKQSAFIGAAFAAAEPDSRRGSGMRQATSQPARAIAEQLLLLAVPTRQGGLDWLTPTPHERGFARLGRVDPGLASGRAGIMTFFAAMARVTGEARYRDVVRRSLAWQAPLRELLARANEPPRLPSGGGIGVGSLVYALTIAGQLLDDASLLDDARAWSAWVPEPRAGDALDVMTGHAGNMLALLALADVAKDDAARRRASVLRAYIGDAPPLEFAHRAEHDCLYEGNAGAIDLALERGEVASELIEELLARAPAYRVPIAPSCPRPGLFDGLAGIGYMLLRQGNPELPCVLLHATLGRR